MSRGYVRVVHNESAPRYCQGETVLTDEGTAAQPGDDVVVEMRDGSRHFGNLVGHVEGGRLKLDIPQVNAKRIELDAGQVRAVEYICGRLHSRTEIPEGAVLK